MLCSALRKRARDRVLRRPRAPDFFLIPVLSVLFNTPPPPFPPSSVSLLLQHLSVLLLFAALFCSPHDHHGSQLASGHTCLGKPQILSAGVSTGHCRHISSRRGQARPYLSIHPGNLHPSGLSLHLLASLPATSVLLHVADRRCTSGASPSPFCLFLFLLETRRSPLVLATRPVGKEKPRACRPVLCISCYSR